MIIGTVALPFTRIKIEMERVKRFRFSHKYYFFSFIIDPKTFKLRHVISCNQMHTTLNLPVSSCNYKDDFFFHVSKQKERFYLWMTHRRINLHQSGWTKLSHRYSLFCGLYSFLIEIILVLISLMPKHLCELHIAKIFFKNVLYFRRWIFFK
jgi:hypothetical protein